MSSNERLRGALVSAGLTVQSFSEQLEVDPKTVERWITQGRLPHRRHRLNAGVLLGKPDHYLWEGTSSDPRAKSASEAELIHMYPSRGSVPVDTWSELLASSNQCVDLHAYAATFLHDAVPDFVDQLVARARAGVRVRLLFGDPASDAVRRRGDEEGIGELLAARCGITWNYFASALAAPGIEAKQHGATLYASIFRFDDTLLVNPHAYGAPAGHSPVLHMTRIPGGRVVDHYLSSFDRVWDSASALSPGGNRERAE